MKKMKPFALLLALMMLLALLTACGSKPTGGGDDEDGDEKEPGQETVESDRNLTPPESTDGKLVFTFFGNLQVASSVNWGDCSLIKLPDGEYILVDACEGGCETHIVQQLQAAGIQHIETAIISHYHSDHYGGLMSFIDAFGIKTVYIDGLELDDSLSWNTNASGLRSYIGRLENKGLTVHTVLAGDSASFGEVTVDFIYPGPDTAAATTNDTSLVFRVSYQGQTALFTGDLYYSAESICMQETDNALLKADLMKIMHHGANTSGSAEFIAAVNPKVAVAMGNHIMTDLNKYRYTKLGCEVYQVWESGDTNVMFDGGEIYVWCEK